MYSTGNIKYDEEMNIRKKKKKPMEKWETCQEYVRYYIAVT